MNNAGKFLNALGFLGASLCGGLAQGTTAFTYQSRLDDNGAPASGIYELRFAIYDVASGGSALAGPLISPGVPVSNGLFTVQLDFASGVFNGDARWLDIGVRTNGAGAFTMLEPRQPITATPYAITAGNLAGPLPGAGLSGTYSNAVTFSNPANSFSGSGAGLTSLDASQLTSGTVPEAALGNAWKLSGNAGTTPFVHFLGTTDDQPLELRVNNQRAFRLTSGVFAPNVVGGSFANQARPGLSGGTIAGGSQHLIESNANYATIAGGLRNTISLDAHTATIGGGELNIVASDANRATICCGYNNEVQTNASESTVSGGYNNHIESNAGRSAIGGGGVNTIETGAARSTIAGGQLNKVSVNATGAAIGGGERNTNGAAYATVPGGRDNLAAGQYSLAAGRRAKASHSGSFVWADDSDADFASTTNKQFAVRANNGLMIQGTNTALELRGGGALCVQGAGISSSTPVFIHRATVANLGGNFTTIDHPHCNNDPNAILIVTSNWNPGGAGGTYNNHPVGVYYNGTRWTIFNQDLAAMPVNAAFNVLVFKP